MNTCVIFSQKDEGQKIFWVQKIFVSQKFGSQKIWVPKNLGFKIIGEKWGNFFVKFFNMLWALNSVG